MKYLAIDPGKTPGYACFDKKGTPIDFGEKPSEDALLDWLESDEVNPDEIIVERYRNRPGMNEWSTGENTTQQIGAIKRVARKKRIPVIEQDPSPCLSMGLRFLGVYQEYYGSHGKGKKKHVPDMVSALAHGTYYLRRKGIS